MTESEYINASNLARVRAAKNVLRDVVPASDQTRETSALMRAVRALDSIEQSLTKKAKVNQ